MTSIDLPLIVFVTFCFAIPVYSVVGAVCPQISIYQADRDYARGMKMAQQKKDSAVWKQRDGKKVQISSMDDSHLANAIRMVARNWGDAKKIDKLKTNLTFKSLTHEAKKRKFTIIYHTKPIITINDRSEYVEVFIPTPRSRIAAGFFPTDWDSRPQE